MKIAFYRAEHGTLLDKVISLVTFSKYSHCELVFSNILCGSSSIRDGGIRFKKIDLESGHWDVFDINYEVDEKLIRYWFELMEGDSYNYIGAFLSVFYIGLKLNDSKYCSEVCALPIEGPNNLSPGALFRYMKKRNYIK